LFIKEQNGKIDTDAALTEVFMNIKRLIPIFLLTFLLAACDPSNLNYLLFDTAGPALEREISFEMTDEPIDSIFYGIDIFLGTLWGHDRHQTQGFNLHYNRRYLEFEHTIFPANQIQDLDIITWAFLYLGRYDNRFAVINFDNDNQLVIQLANSPHGRNDVAILSYRQQNSDALNQQNLDWWDIATATFKIGRTSIPWEGFVELETGGFAIRRLTESPISN